MDSDLAKAALQYLARATHSLQGVEVPALMKVMKELDDLAEGRPKPEPVPVPAEPAESTE